MSDMGILGICQISMVNFPFSRGFKIFYNTLVSAALSGTVQINKITKVSKFVPRLKSGR